MTKIAQDWPGQTPERQRRIQAAFTDGRFAVHALAFSTHTELLEMEDLVHDLSYASGLARAAALPLPRDAKMTDVALIRWFLPTLLRHAGVDFLHLGCNAASTSPEVPSLFWWEGPGRFALADHVFGGRLWHRPGSATGLAPPNLAGSHSHR